MEIWRNERNGARPTFKDRVDAGAVLADHLTPFSGPDTVVLGIPRGGVVVAAEVARRLNAPLDVVVARKLGAPVSAELAIGAVTANGGRFLDHAIIEQLSVSEPYITAVTAVQQAEARRREERFRAGLPPLVVRGRTAILVDDGLATGSTMRAAVRSIRKEGPGRVVVAVPVGSTQACAALRAEADTVVCPFELIDFGAVGWYYTHFEQTTDDEVQDLLDRARGATLTTAPGEPR